MEVKHNLAKLIYEKRNKPSKRWIKRSQFNETSEALFLNSGFVYESAEQAEAIFKGDETGYQYSRYSNPTVDMFEKRLALLDKSEEYFATASGMSAVFRSPNICLKSIKSKSQLFFIF